MSTNESDTISIRRRGILPYSLVRRDLIGTPPAQFYQYDDTGNTLSDGTRTFTYNAAGRMDSATSNGAHASYRYNAMGERVSKTVDGITTLFQFGANGQLLGEYDSNGHAIREYVYLDNEPLAMLSSTDTPLSPSEPPPPTTQSRLFFFHNDHLGTPLALTDTFGTIAWAGERKPFGQTAIITELVENPLRLPGQYYERETGLHYNYFRDYDPSTGRYIQSDPIGLEGGINTYAYVESNPLNSFDPWGLRPIGGGSIHPHPGGWGPGGPRYGNWVGGGWSGGKSGNAPPVDSLDECGMAHDFCWAKCENELQTSCPMNPGQCKDQCNREFTRCVSDLSGNPRNWPNPPLRPDLDNFSRGFRGAAKGVGKANFFWKGPK